MKLSTALCIITLACCALPTSAQSPWPIVFKLISFGVGLITKDKNFMEDKVSIPDMINDVSTSIMNVERTLKESQAKIIHEVDRLINYHQTMHDLTTNGVYIDQTFDNFATYSKNGTFENDTLRDFARSATSHDSNQLPSVVSLIYRLVKPTGRDSIGLFDLLIQDKTTKEQQAAICGATLSTQQDVFLLYNIVGMYMVKGYAMRVYSYHVLRQFGLGHYDTEIASAKDEFARVMQGITVSALDTMRKASRDIRPCDAKNHKEGETFLQLKWLFNMMSTNVIYLNEKKQCRLTCDKYTEADFYQRNYKGRPDRCQGRVYNCFEQYGFQQCAPTTPYRRWNGIEGVVMMIGKDIPARGNVTNCQRSQLRPENQAVRIDPVYPCHECFCHCDDSEYSESVRVFSTRMIEADRNRNYVITGVRFVERKKIFHIQIQQGKLGPNNTIDVSTVHWKPIDEFDWRYVSYDNYHMIKWGRQNQFQLDEVEIGYDQVLTGVGLRKAIINDGRLKLQVQADDIDFERGVLKRNIRYYEGSTFYPEDLPIEDQPHIPTLAPDENIVHIEDGKQIHFRQTDWYKDAAQTAIPFLDAQPVVADPPVPVAGVGLFYKGLKGYGGFIGLKLKSYDYTKFIETPSQVKHFSTLIKSV